ncbi:MAG: metallophosphoesterase family protein [Desulfosporosinus sp.]|nr:metallophosphoesterase family protein [Desulfosporosinus sp.]
MLKNSKTGKIALSVLLATAVMVSAGSLSQAKADISPIVDTSAIADFALPNVTGSYNINVGVGSDPTELDFNWFTQSLGTTQIKIAPTSTMSGKSFPASAITQTAAQTAVTATESINQDETLLPDANGVAAVSNYQDNVFNGKLPAAALTGEYANKATVTGLTASAKYSYSVSDGKGNWSPIYTVSTLSANSVSFAAFGDPQIGAFDDSKGTAKSDPTGGHKSVTDDKTGWSNMLKLVTQNKNLNFLFSMGDQVNDYNYLIQPSNAADGQWYQYNYFFNPDATNNYIQDIPLAAFSGNHDHQMGEYYGYHYNQPNRSSLGATRYGNDGDYWFTAGPTLFIVLNANNYGTADHDQFMDQAVKANPNVKWKVAVWHQSAYSEANHNTSNDIEDPVLTIRNTWPKLMDKYGVDVVLQGHDHYYTRTAQMLGGNVINPVTGDPEILKDNTSSIPGTKNTNATYGTKEYPASVINPKGTVYFTLDSGTGSKYYNLNSGTNDSIGGSSDHSFSVVGWQGYVPSYSYVTFTDKTFTIKTYSTTDYTLNKQSLIDSYTISKTS